MRVAVVTESFLPQVNGVTNSVCRILEFLAAEGHQALVVAPAPPAAAAQSDSYAGFPVVGVPGVGLPGYRDFTVGLPTTRRVERILREFAPDVVHLASPIALGAAGARAARRLGVPSVAVFQTDVAGFARQHGLRGTDTVIWSWLRHIHKQAELTLVPSRSSFDQLRAQGVPRLAMWRRGVDSERFNPAHRDEVLREWLLGADREVLVGYVGRLAADKRVHLLAHLADLPRIRLVAVGDGPAATSLRSLIPSAVLPGFLSGEALSAMYASFDIFVHTGADDTFGQCVQEAMVSGVPVVAPAVGGPLDLVVPDRTGLLFAPDDTRALRRAVSQLAADPMLRATFGKAARLAVVNRTWSAVCGELMEHYRSAVGPVSMLAVA
jgi:phosphatidylinositol alpha 1,6-mannosyltransferase